MDGLGLGQQYNAIGRWSVLGTGEIIRRHRERLGLSQAELGAKVGRTKQWVSELERGHIRISYDMAKALASVFGQTPDALFLSSQSNLDGQAVGQDD